MPLAEKAELIVREMKPTDVSLFRTLARFVKQRFPVNIPASEWAKAELPLHLRTRVAVTDHEGKEIAAARNLDILRKSAVAFYFGGKAAVMKAMAEALKREVFRKNVRNREDLDVLAAGGVSESIKAELARLVPANFLEIRSMDALRQLPRRLDALKIRAERAKYDPEKDRKKVEQVEPYALALERIVKRFDRDTSPEKKAAVEELRGLIEEFRMSLFAPEVKTAFPIFAKRLVLKIKEIEAMG